VGSGGFGLGEFLLPKEPDASRTASRSGDGHGGAMPLAAEEAAMTCLKPQGGRRKRPKTSLRISLRSPITTQLTTSQKTPGGSDEKPMASAGVVAVEVARLEGIEPPTHGLEARQLSPCFPPVAEPEVRSGIRTVLRCQAPAIQVQTTPK
jgi:hypothetical protein